MKAPLIGLGLFVFGTTYSLGQTYGQKQNKCITESTDKNGSIIYTNTDCPYKVHIYWAQGNKRFDNYVQPKEMHETLMRGPLSLYACELGYIAVDGYDHPITQQVTNWACLKQ